MHMYMAVKDELKCRIPDRLVESFKAKGYECTLIGKKPEKPRKKEQETVEEEK